MFRNKIIGILGGVGPRASAHFLQAFIRKLNERGISQDGDFPTIILLSLPLDEWGITGAHDKMVVAGQLQEAAKWLDNAGVEIIAIPCNTVHEFHDQLQSKAPILNIIEETLRDAPQSVGVLCSRQSRESRLYERGGRNVLYVADQSVVDAVIGSAMAGLPSDIDCLVAQLKAKGAEAIILGCTELSFCHYTSASVIDSTERLAEALAGAI